MKSRFDRIHSILSLKKIILRLAVLLVVAVVFPSCNLYPRESTPERHLPQTAVWPQEDSDLSPDPDTIFGRLDNGLRYIIKANHTPRGRVSMHLLVRVGSLAEQADERGIAHFLEHMVFNGSKHFAPGEMIKYFQRIGMQFGPDANAHTGFSQTVFDVDLPRSDAQSLSEGLVVLRDYADGALLLPEEVAREKKVILAEMRSRDSYRFRAYKAVVRFELPGLLFGQRFPIGEAALIEKMDSHMLRNFYETWYRPESMILIMVGDMNPDTAKGLISERFHDLKARRPLQMSPAIGTMKHQGIKPFHHHEEESGTTRVAIETIVQQSRPSDSIDGQKQELVRQMADAMIQNRLDAMVRNSRSVLTDADIASGYYLKQVKYAQIEADCRPHSWEKGLWRIEQALRTALKYGFTPAEMLRVKNDFRAGLLKAVQEESTRDSNHLVRKILDDLNDWQVFQSPRQRADMLLPFLETVTLEQVHKALAENWKAEHRLILVTGDEDLRSGSKPAEEQIMRAYMDAERVKVSPPAELKPPTFPYLSKPQQAGKIVYRRTVRDIGIEQVKFSNGFHLNLKPTRFKDNQVLATLCFGSGEVSEPADLPGLSEMTQAVVNESGFGRLNRIELEAALSGRLAQTDLEIREDMITINAEAATNELPLLFQLLHAHIVDPGFRENARQLVLNRFEQEYAGLAHSVDGMMALKGRNFLAGGDHRFGAPPLEHLRQRTIEQIKRWFERQIRLGPMELNIVGDFDAGEAVKLAANYFGSMQLAQGKDKQTVIDRQPEPVFPRGKRLALTVDTDIAKALVVVAFPTEDFWDIQRTRRLMVLAELFSERLRERIREKMGAAYSPYAFNHSYRAYKGYGLIQNNVLVDPRQADAIVREIVHIAADLGSEKSEPDEFKRVLDPILAHIKDLRRKNNYWLDNVLTGVTRHPGQLGWSRTIEKDYAAIKAGEIETLARLYLAPDNAAVIIVRNP